MKAILIDDQQCVKIINLSSDSEISVADHFVPCGGCGLPVLYEFSSDGVCCKCFQKATKDLEDKGWRYEHPGYWTKNFGERITVIAGDSEYRFDFTFAGAVHDMAYGPDWSIEVEDWCKDHGELSERGCFSTDELDELELVYNWLYISLMASKRHEQGNWVADYGSLENPEGFILQHKSLTRGNIMISQHELFSLQEHENMNPSQAEKFRELCAIITAYCGEFLA